MERPMSDDTDITYNLDLLQQSKDTWEHSSGLRELYADLYADIHRTCIEGPSLELGSGIGACKDFIPNVVTSDITETPYVDCAMSAYDIEPPAANEWRNIFALDVLHHLRFPLRFLESAASQLKQDGRIILIEPAATFGGTVFYKLFHQEPIERHKITEPFEFEPNGPDGEFANMGMAVGAFRDRKEALDEILNSIGLKVSEISYRDILAYPLTGGYSKGQLAPTCIIRFLLKLENKLPQWLMKRLGLRMRIVIEKR